MRSGPRREFISRISRKVSYPISGRRQLVIVAVETSSTVFPNATSISLSIFYVRDTNYYYFD